MKLLVLKGASQHDVLTVMAEQLRAAFDAIGVQTSVLSVAVAEPLPVLRDAIGSGAFDSVFSFGSFGADALGADGRSLYEGLQHGFIGWNVDHPSYHFARLTAPVARRHTICASNAQVQFMEFMGTAGRKLPMLPGMGAVDDLKPWADRPIDLLVAASWIGRPERWWAGAVGTPVHDLLDGVLERLLADPELNLLNAYSDAMSALAIQAPLSENLAKMLSLLLTYVRQFDRIRILESLLASGLKVTVCGDEWKEILGSNPRITYLPSLDFARLNALYSDCKVVLNMNAANGGSERAIAAMAAGAAVVSDHGPLLESAFGAAIGFYSRTKPSTAVETIKGLLDDNAGAREAELRRTLIREDHLWIHKAQQIRSAVESAYPGV